MTNTDPPNAAELEREVAAERTRVEETIDAIQRRLTPGQLVDEVLHHTQRTGSDFASNLGKTISANPIPAALLGIGLVWLLLAQRPPAAAPPPPASDPTLPGSL
jgi:hypothetical protein